MAQKQPKKENKKRFFKLFIFTVYELIYGQDYHKNINDNNNNNNNSNNNNRLLLSIYEKVIHMLVF